MLSQMMVRIFFNDTAGKEGVAVALDENGKTEMGVEEFKERIQKNLEGY